MGSYDERIEAAVARIEYAAEEAVVKINDAIARIEEPARAAMDKLSSLFDKIEAIETRVEALNELETSVVIPSNRYGELLLELQEMNKILKALSASKDKIKKAG
jgi:phage shock protein A